MWLFSEKIGKISCIAKGAKKSKSKLLSSTLSFSFGNYTVYKGKSFYIMEECENIESFQQFLNDFDDLTYASYFCELMDIVMIDEESNRELFREFLTVLYLLKSKAIDREILARAFEIKVLTYTGYSLNLDTCCMCKKVINTSKYINLQYFGGVCNECSKENGLYLSNTAYNIIKYLSKITLDKVHRVLVPEQTKKELYMVLQNIICSNYSRKPKSLELLNYL